MNNKLPILFGLIFIFSCNLEKEKNIGSTMITKWQGDKKTAISITYDDGIINQFTVAKPIMDKFQMPGTFYVITGKITGAKKVNLLADQKKQLLKKQSLLKRIKKISLKELP